MCNSHDTLTQTNEVLTLQISHYKANYKLEKKQMQCDEEQVQSDINEADKAIEHLKKMLTKKKHDDKNRLLFL